MRAVAVILIAALAGCASSGDAGALNPDGSGSGSGAAPSCGVSISFEPTDPVAGPSAKVRATAHVTHGPGVLGYAWQVLFDGKAVEVTPVPPDGANIDFPVTAAGVYVVDLIVEGSSCPQAIAPVNVRAPGAQSELVRLRVVPPRSAGVPAMEKLIEVQGGADADLGILNIDTGVSVGAMVIGPGGGVPAYLQFSPGGAPDAVVEAFSDALGAAAVRLVPGPYAVLVVPSIADVAPRRITGWSPGAVLRLDAGTRVTGTVHDPADAPLAGATVRLTVDGVPSTVATTVDPDGGFALRAPPGSAVAVEVVPPAASGLPRLLATSPSFDLGMPLQIRYAANVAVVDLAGTAVQRLGAPVPRARLTVIGSLPAIGVVTAGTQVVATGQVQLAAIADAAGVLPTTRVPSAALSAVVEAASGDLAVIALDTRAGAPASLDAPAPQLITTAVLDGGGAGMVGALVDLVPTGALALATAPTLRIAAGAAGVIAARLPAGGRYELRFQDPAGRAAPLVVADRAITTIASSYTLPAAVRIRGTLRRDGTQVLANASVQILCQACTGIARTRPLAEVASDAAGRFTVAVRDPGTR
ncbi:MAG TPA: carboxypeptidase-like regulatory domain-containing protein [Kofleriaceae bacterium]